MRQSLAPSLVIGLAVVLAAPAVASPPAPKPAAAPERKKEVLVEASPPPFSDGIFPCSSCHDGKSMKPDPKRRELAFHDEQQSVFDHDSEHRWCVDCHDLQNRDVLRLASGATLPFTESYRLCGQCHGEKYRDWRAGVHGRRTGSWNGAKQYLLCANCHNPHQPHFKALAPKPAPQRPNRNMK